MRTLLFSLLFLSACAPYAETNRAYRRQAKDLVRGLQRPPEDSLHTASFWAGTTNFNLRKPNLVIIHHTAQAGCPQTLRTFTLTRTAVSAHYVICRDGTVHHMLHDGLRAWHAGVGSWGPLTDVNSASIGIELDNDGVAPFPEVQIRALMGVLGALKKAHGIPQANFIGHSDVAPARKVDPNIHFPWQRLAREGYGRWYRDTTGVMVPQGFDPHTGLRLIGYSVRDSGAARAAFRRKFLQRESRDTFSAAEQKVVWAMVSE